LGYLEGIRCCDFLREKESICVPFLDPEDIKILSLEAIRKFGKGCPELIHLY